MFQKKSPPTENGTKMIYKTIEKTNWLVTLAIVGTGAGFFSFLNGSKSGLKIMAACLVVMSMGLMVIKYNMIIAIATMVTSVVLMVYTTLTRNKALKEVVIGNEIAKQRMENSSVPFNPMTTLKDSYNFAQSALTKEIVAWVKKKENGKNGN